MKLYNIFETIFQLWHSCILVNRLWCHWAMPLLWEDPFSAFAFKNNTRCYFPLNKFCILEIYLQYVNDDDKKILRKYGIDSLYLFPSNTLFNYPIFIKYLNVQEVLDSFCCYLDKYPNKLELDGFVRLMMYVLSIEIIFNSPKKLYLKTLYHLYYLRI